MEFTENPEFARWRTPVPHPWFNGVLSAQTPGANAEQIVRETIDYFLSNNVNSFTWWQQASLPTQAWLEVLVPFGLRYTNETPGMAANITELPHSIQHPDQLQIRTVENLDTLKEWTHTFIDGYEIPPDFLIPFHNLVASLGIDLPFRYYIAYLYGKPVATSTLFLGAGAAGIYNVATISEARGQGIGAFLTLYPLKQALPMGFSAGVLQSSEMGFSVYQRLGFRKVCEMDHYYWSAPD